MSYVLRKCCFSTRLGGGVRREKTFFWFFLNFFKPKDIKLSICRGFDSFFFIFSLNSDSYKGSYSISKGSATCAAPVDSPTPRPADSPSKIQTSLNICLNNSLKISLLNSSTISLLNSLRISLLNSLFQKKNSGMS